MSAICGFSNLHSRCDSCTPACAHWPHSPAFPAPSPPPDLSLSRAPVGRLREEQERAERSKEESSRLLRGSEDSLDSTSVAANNIRGGHGGKRASLADIDEGAEQRDRHISSSTSLADDEMFDTMLVADAGTGRGSLELPALDDGSNFEDEFDPILASIRKPQKKEPAFNAKAFRAGASGRCASQPFPVRGDQEGALPSSPSPKDDASETNRGDPNARSAFSAGFLSISPGSMRARAGDVMAQSSAQISRSANAFRSALENSASSALDSRKRRQSDPPRPTDGAIELEEGMAGKGASGSRRATGGREGGEMDDVRLVSADELLSEEEVSKRQNFGG